MSRIKVSLNTFDCTEAWREAALVTQQASHDVLIALNQMNIAAAGAYLNGSHDDAMKASHHVGELSRLALGLRELSLAMHSTADDAIETFKAAS